MEGIYQLVAVFLCAFLACIVFDTIKLWKAAPVRRVRDIAMAQHRRQRWVKRRVQYGLSECLEELYYRDLITKEERDFWLVRCANRLDMKDLLPKRNPVRFPDPTLLKAAIKSRGVKRSLKMIVAAHRKEKTDGAQG
jgi:hypothetical protein